MKIIVSSKVLWLLLEREKINHSIDDDNDIVIEIIDNRLFIGTNPQGLSVEFREPGQESVSYRKINTLRKILKAAEDQPVVLLIKGDSIGIQNIEI